jgi:hypothetical protein
MKNLLSILLAMFFGISVVGCIDGFLNEKETTVKTSIEVEILGDVWVLIVDVKKDNKIQTITHISKFLIEKEFKIWRKYYVKKINQEEQLTDFCILDIIIGSGDDVKSSKLIFLVGPKNLSNEPINPYDPRVMEVVKDIYSLMINIEKGEIQ